MYLLTLEMTFKISSIAVFHDAQQALDCEKCKYLHPSIELNLVTPMEELGEGLKDLKKDRDSASKTNRVK